jgi:hypothetical protein
LAARREDLIEPTVEKFAEMMGKLTGTDDVLVVEHGAPVQRGDERGTGNPDEETDEHETSIVGDRSGQSTGNGGGYKYSGHYTNHPGQLEKRKRSVLFVLRAY